MEMATGPSCVNGPDKDPKANTEANYVMPVGYIPEYESVRVADVGTSGLTDVNCGDQ